jgi:uncharacterized membrane-anchored protein YhcB (DUF1043 family)
VEYINSLWQVGIIALAAGAMIGALAYRYFSPSVRQSEEIKSELDHAKRELSSYRASVNSHFEKTSELVNDLTQNYVKVYRHLAEGAQTLGNSRELNSLLEQQQGKVLLTVGDETDAAETAVDSKPASSTTAETVQGSAQGDDEPLPADDPEVTGSPEKATAASSAEPPPEVIAESTGKGDEPLAAGNDERPEAEKSAQQTGIAAKAQTATAGSEEIGEPVLDVDKIKSVDTGETTASVETGRVSPEREDIHKAPPTRH